MSTKALRQICDRVTGADISAEMVRAASALYTEPEYSFVQTGAEEIKSPPDTYDIVTAAGVINWIDEKRFLPQMAGVMKEGGILLIYDFWISGRMEGKPAFTEWYEKEYLRQFPKPPRKERVWTKEDAEAFHFEMFCQETYSMDCEMSLEQFVRFMLLQSNVIAQVEEKGEDIETVRQYLEESARPYFASGMKEKLIFDGYSWYLRLQN